MSVSTNQINYLIWRYLQESGLELSTYALQHDTKVDQLDEEYSHHVGLGCLVNIIQKGILYMASEASVEEDGKVNLDTDVQNLHLFDALSFVPGVSDGSYANDNESGGVDKKDQLDKSLEVIDEGNNGNNGAANRTATNFVTASDAIVDTDDAVITGTVPTPGSISPKISQATSSPSVPLTSLTKALSEQLNVSETRDAQIQVDILRLPTIIDLQTVLSLPPVQQSRFSPSASHILAIAANDSSSSLVTIPNDTRIRLIGPSGPGAPDHEITALSWNDTGTVLATATFDGQINLWTSEGRLRHILSLHRAPVLEIRWNKLGNLLLSIDCTNMVVVWDAFSGEIRQHFQPIVVGSSSSPDIGGHSNDISIGTDADWIDPVTFAATGEPATIMVYKVGERAPLLRFKGHTQGINSLEFDQATQLLASGSDDHTVRIWHGKSAGSVVTLTGHDAPVMRVIWLPSAGIVNALDPAAYGGTRLVSASLDGTIRVWDPSKGVCLAVLAFHEDAIFCCEISPNGKWLASGGLDGVVLIWDVSEITDIESSTKIPRSRLSRDPAGSRHVRARYELLPEERSQHTNVTVGTLSWNADSSAVIAGYPFKSVILDLRAEKFEPENKQEII